jgi:integrase
MTAYIRDRVRVLAPGTAERYARSLEAFLAWALERGVTTASVLSRSTLASFYEWLAGDGRHGRPRADSTRRKIVEVVQLAWAWAANDDEWSAFVPPPRTLEMRPRQSVATVAPKWSEMDAVITAFPVTSWRRRLCILLRFTGLRVAQAMLLKWSDVDMEACTLRVRPELGKSRQEKRGRIVPISVHLVTLTKGWGAREGYLVKTKNRGERERIARAKEMVRAWRRSGVREEVWRGRAHHAFRKGFVSGLCRAGADADAVEYLVGHSLGLRGVYLDPDALALREAVALVPRLSRLEH